MSSSEKPPLCLNEIQIHTSYKIICDLLQIAWDTGKKYLLSQHPDPSQKHLDDGKPENTQ
jgi:hypothetical protein